MSQLRELKSHLNFRKVIALCLVGLSYPNVPQVKSQVRIGSEIEQEKQVRKGILFGVQLSPPSVKLLREVERAFGQPIRQSMTLQGDSEAGATGVGMDGIPVIALNERIGKREEVIVHELLHLKLFAEGYHQIVFVPGTGINKAGFDTLSRLILHPMIFSEIEHSVFYPRMRRMKLDPVFDQRKFWEEALNAAPTQGDQATLRRIYGLYYFKAATQMEDPALLKRSAELYTRNGYGGALELGTLLTSLYAQSMPMTPAKALKLVVDFCNLVFSDTFAFSIIVSGPERRGDYRLPMAYIQMDAKAAPARSL